MVLLTVLVTVAFAQTGKITGKVTDKKTGETLIGLSVKLDGSAKGASTDVSGNYALTGLAPGKYTIVFSYIGYQPKRITDVDVQNGKPAIVNVVMEDAPSQRLAEVVITATARQESVNSLYAAQKNRAVISDGISSDQITRSPDKSTGEVLKRVSGTTIQDNKFVIVRGLGDRYNNARLDNASLPSTEANRKAFSFDIVPSNLVDNIVISKTATPDLPGDFAGGSVQIITRDIPAQNFFTVSLGAGYNSQSTFKDFYYGPRYLSDYFAFNTERQLPTTGFPKNTSQTLSLTQEQSTAAIKKLPGVWNIGNSLAAPSQNHQLSLGRVKDFNNGGRFGVIASLTYRNSQTTVPDAERTYLFYDYDDRVNQFSTAIGALANLSYTKGKNKFSFKNLYNRILEDRFTYRVGSDFTRSSDLQYYAFDMLQKGLLKTSVEGEHTLGANKNRFTWNLAYSNVINNQPDQRKIGYQRTITDRDNPEVPYLASVLSINKENNRLFSDLKENIYNGGLNYQVPLKISSQPATLKLGAGTQYRTRDFAARLLGSVLNGFDEDVQTRPINTLYGKDLVNANYYRLDEITSLTDSYDANSLTSFGYAMLDNKLANKLRVVWGLRAENFNLKLNSFRTSGEPLNVERNDLDLLPSANFTYALTPKSNLRASYYRTLARPEFTELAPFAYYDYEVLAVRQGNENLKSTNIDNADLRYELYPGTGQVFSVSAFYKHFNNAIEPSIDDVNSTPTISYYNTKQAVNYGAELEFRHTLGFLKDNSESLNNTTIYVNGAYIKSKVNNPANAGYLRDNRPMVGQSPYTINAGLQYNAFQNALNLSVLYNRIGKRITSVGGQRLENVWENPRNVLDFQANYRVIKGKGQIKLNVSDILNNQSLFYFDYDGNGKYTPLQSAPADPNIRQDEVFSRFKRGVDASLSFSYNF
nr:TonB-dependent receptor [Hufsiella arboris]